MAAATAVQTLTALSRMLKVTEADMAGYWSGIVSEAVTFATQEVYGCLLKRGFRLIEDILPWDRLNEFTLDLALWKAIHRGGAYAGFDPEALEVLDRRKDLADVLVFVNGDWVKPPAGNAGMVATGGPRVGDTGGVFGWDPTDPSGNNGISW